MTSAATCSRRFKFAVALALAPLACSVITTTALAELPPAAYESSQREAPEMLEVEITSVEQAISYTAEEIVTSVTLLAKVLKVKRTATKLKVGATITVVYDVRQSKRPGWAGPSKVTIPKKGEKCPAYLKLTKEKSPSYQPAAGGYTFRTVKV